MRYLPLDAAERRAMLRTIGVADVDALFADIPADKRIDGLLDMPLAMSEMAVERRMAAFSGPQRRGGLGPVLPRRRRLQAPRAGDRRSSHPALGIPDELHALSAGDLAGHAAGAVRVPDPGRGADRHGGRQRLDVRRLDRAARGDADGASPDEAAQGGALRRPASAICRGLRDARAYGGRFDSSACRPTSRRARTSPRRSTSETSCVIVQSPDFFGNPRDLKPIADAAHAKGALLIAVFTDPVALAAVQSPGEMDADIVVGEGQAIGNALNFGGPYVGLFATRLKFVRQMPGRLAGETVDADGRRSFVLTLSTREQHIRREKATSNICTNSGLCALAFSIHLTLLGGEGLRRLARGQSRQRGASSPSGSPPFPASRSSTAFLQRIHDPHAAPRGRADRGAGGERESSAACRSRGSCPAPASTTASSSRAPRSTRTTTARPTRARSPHA